MVKAGSAQKVQLRLVVTADQPSVPAFCHHLNPLLSTSPNDLLKPSQILKHGFWNTHEQRATIAQLVAALANPINASAFELADQAQSVYEGVMAAQRSGDPNLSSSKVVIEGNDKLREIRKRLRQLLDQAKAEGRKTDRILKIGQRVREMNEAVAALILGALGEEAF